MGGRLLSRLRSFGAATMAMVAVASGSVDGYFEFGPHCWDFAAGDLIVREAQGTVVDVTGTRLVAAAPPPSVPFPQAASVRRVALVGSARMTPVFPPRRPEMLSPCSSRFICAVAHRIPPLSVCLAADN